ncbi:hypothetical protein CR513_15555, partial [Mucuna pruriens]
MASHAHNDKLLIHFFQESLTGAAFGWYLNLEKGLIWTWKDIAKAFLKEAKTFKEYAQCWRELATNIHPLLSEKEMVTMFIDTLQPPFFEKMVGNVSSNFADLVIDNRLRLAPNLYQYMKWIQGERCDQLPMTTASSSCNVPPEMARSRHPTIDDRVDITESASTSWEASILIWANLESASSGQDVSGLSWDDFNYSGWNRPRGLPTTSTLNRIPPKYTNYTTYCQYFPKKKHSKGLIPYSHVICPNSTTPHPKLVDCPCPIEIDSTPISQEL